MRAFLATLPLIAFLLCFLILRQRCKNWRIAYLSAAVAWGGLLTAITEGLSLFSLIRFKSVLAAWILSIAALLLIYRNTQHKQSQPRSLDRPLRSITQLRKSLFLHPFLVFTVSGIALIILPVALIAVVAPPNNWDSMVYHMARVVNWIQDQNVNHYPTRMQLQLDQPPWSSFAIMHLQILSGGDRFANLVQWSSMLGSLIGVSLIAQLLGASLKGQALSALVCATIPMGILQSSSTQNDYVVAFWLVCFVAFCLMVLNEQKLTLSNSLRLGASLGLALLTKGTATVYTVPLCLVFGLVTLWQNRQMLARFVRLLLPGLCTMLAIVGGHWWRNLELYHSIFGNGGVEVRNKLYSVPALLSNAIRNLSIHTTLPDDRFNHAIEQAIRFVHQFLGLDVNDPRTTFPAPPNPFHVPVTVQSFPISLQEDAVGNPFHLLLIVICIILYIGRKQLRRPEQTTYLTALIGIFWFYCLIINWQIWASRFHLPLFVLFSAFVGTTLARTFAFKAPVYVISVLLLLLAFPCVLYNSTRPLAINPSFVNTLTANGTIFNVSRDRQYLAQMPDDWAKSYLKSARFLKRHSCRDVGFMLNQIYDEYRFWALLKGDPRPFRFKQLDIYNPSVHAKFQHPSRQFKACTIIATWAQPDPKIPNAHSLEMLRTEGNDYIRVKANGQIDIFSRYNPAPAKP